MKHLGFVRNRWFICILILTGGAGCYFWIAMQNAFETMPLELTKLYELAEKRDFDELEKGFEEGHGMFRALDEQYGPVESFQVTGIYLRLPIWGEIYGTAYRRGKPFHVVGYLESGKVNYFDEHPY